MLSDKPIRLPVEYIRPPDKTGRLWDKPIRPPDRLQALSARIRTLSSAERVSKGAPMDRS
mgnify:CR=1 FL=1